MFLARFKRKVAEHFQRSWKIWLLVLGLFFVIPLFLAILDTRDIPRPGNYTEICTHGLPAQGTIGSVSEGQDADDDHWLVVHFVYTHDGRRHFGETTTDNGDLRPGTRVDVRYLGSQAALPAIAPLNINPTADFWLCLWFGFFIAMPPSILLGLILIGIFILFRRLMKIVLPICSVKP